VLVLEGELDMAEALMLEAALGACGDNLPVVVDLTSLSLLDSCGLDVLLRNRASGRPAAIVRAPGSSLARVLDIVEADKTIPFYDDLTEAVDYLQAASEALR
jgi:anti-anti-sigma factor